MDRAAKFLWAFAGISVGKRVSLVTFGGESQIVQCHWSNVEFEIVTVTVGVGYFDFLFGVDE